MPRRRTTTWPRTCAAPGRSHRSTAAPPGGQEEPGGGPGPVHPPMNTTHAHPHSAYGAQGGDTTHDHSHTHAGDANHDHAHASAGPKMKGAADVELSDEQKAQIRAALGLADDEEVTAEHVMAMAAKVAEAAAAEPVAASALPPGVVAVDRDVWEDT